MRISALVVAISMVAAPVLNAQERRTPVFGAEATMVRLSVAVIAELPGPLTSADFTVYDNGKKQEVVFFDEKSLPLDISLFVDTSASLSIKEMPSGNVRLRPGIAQSAKRFVDILKPGDRMEVIDFSSRSETLQELTADAALLRSAIARLDAPCTPEEQDLGLRCAGGGSTLLSRTLYLKFDELRRMLRDPEHPRRRVLLFITDGVDTGSYISEKTLRTSARRAEVSIYVLALQPNISASQGTAEEVTASAESVWLMQQLCKETGGAFLPALTSTDLESLAKKISTEMAAEYTIGWAPSAPEGKDRWHTVQVAVRGVPSDRLRYRNGYLSVKP